jgi:thioredoxin-dependent peroxiredoxin
MNWHARSRVWVSILCGMLCFCAFASAAFALQVGDKAPEFTLPGTTANEIKLADYLGKKPVVLFFYIGAFTNA